MQKKHYTQEDGIRICSWIESKLAPKGYHCALGGSLMYRGTSTKDIDVIVYPRDGITRPMNKNEVISILLEAGMTKMHPEHIMRSGYQKIVSAAGVLPMITPTGDERVDIFFMNRA